MKSFFRNATMILFIVSAMALIWSCAEKQITFDQPGVQIWRMTMVYADGTELKDLTLVLSPSKTEKNVFYVTADTDTEATFKSSAKLRVHTEWKGEVRKSLMQCDISFLMEWLMGVGDVQGDYGNGTAKGTFSDRRASGTFKMEGRAFYSGKWTAERIS